MRTLTLSFLLVLSLGSAVAFAAPSADEQRETIRKGAAVVLADLYARSPGARSAVEKSAGYAVFRNFGMKILFAGGGKGKGIVVDNATGKETFMNMVEVQAGLGIGVKKFNVVFVFESQSLLQDFVESGWEFGGQVTAAAMTDEGGVDFAEAVSVKPGVWMYQLTDEGLAAEITGKGTRYYKDDELNR